jgi:hypothetical protein
MQDDEARLDRMRDMLRHFPTLLARWSGADARMGSLDAYCPRTLRLNFTRPDHPGFLCLACVGPEFIHGPTEWRNAQVTVSLDPKGEGFLVRDAAADLSILTASVQIAEHHDRRSIG